MKADGSYLNSLYSLLFLRYTIHGIFFAVSKWRRRLEAWAKEHLWVITIKKEQKKSLLKGWKR